MAMSYRSAAMLGFVIGVLTLPLFLVGLAVIWRSLDQLRAYREPLAAGTRPQACGWNGLGHDWRPSLPGFPPGVACRNCLLRKDRAVVAWTWMPSGIPAVQRPPHQVWVPKNAAKARRKRNVEPQLLMMDAKPVVPQEIKMEIVGFESS